MIRSDSLESIGFNPEEGWTGAALVRPKPSPAAKALGGFFWSRDDEGVGNPLTPQETV
jgi:hypothetical protein